ncbi:MAG TPA: hypothetical protein VFQ61_04970 [Polyangiaceae bacterium]|nr:hypothetical protein [Polyangiaceae bacterium]
MQATSDDRDCHSCGGVGELPTDFGPRDCPDCGGAGFLPSRNVLVEWRARDIERALAAGINPAAVDVRWLLAELRNARKALTDVIALAHDVQDGDAIAMRIRISASRALGL